MNNTNKSYYREIISGLLIPVCISFLSMDLDNHIKILVYFVLFILGSYFIHFLYRIKIGSDEVNIQGETFQGPIDSGQENCWARTQRRENIISLLNSQTETLSIITGSSGSGKTHLIKYSVISKLEKGNNSLNTTFYVDDYSDFNNFKQNLVDKINSTFQDYATKWLWTYNHERPNTAIGGITPKQKLAQLTH